ncbi:hypothetical protein MJO28_006606 [Puccinia striiformis f. sp. tritici]|uniref:Uncharacterized protein n=1 Tax=Puccinia striiformis f. sp. tritici TaxID=168172 RepID=A0ACC0EHW7_9BASI|nr:hypothetical protein MJO28_006606 [Puccinia striiformis f. sp. tritici]
MARYVEPCLPSQQGAALSDADCCFDPPTLYADAASFTNDPPQSGRPKRKLPNEPEREIHSDQPPKRWRAIKTKVVLRTAGLTHSGTADILPNQGGSGTTPVVPNTYRRPIHGWPPLQHNFLQPPQPDLLPTPQPNLLPTTQPIFYQQLSQISYQQLSQSSTNNSAKSSTNPSIRSPSNNSAQSFTTSRQRYPWSHHPSSKHQQAKDQIQLA